MAMAHAEDIGARDESVEAERTARVQEVGDDGASEAGKAHKVQDKDRCVRD